MKAAGNSSDGRSCCFSDGTANTPKPVITTAMRATSPRLARLSLANNDMGELSWGKSGGDTNILPHANN